ncbi:hypothetical protein [Janibacter terrae]|uniref:hypothetical protein n=1 Tax=Janibacter terrae TaxID=103817 RepID=UPI0031F7AC38
MSGPESPRGGDAFDDFFGDPTPSGRMGPAPDQPAGTPFADADDETTRAMAPARPEADPEATQAAEVLPPITPEPTPHGAVPEAWWAPEPESAPPQRADGGHGSTWQPVPSAGPARDEPQPYREPGHPGRSVSPLALVAMLVGGVLLGGLCVGGLVMTLGGGDEPVAQSTTVTEPGTPPDSTSSGATPPSTSSTPPSSSSSSSTTAARTGQLPAGASRCAGPKDGTSVARGTQVTSCEFAAVVRDAYLAEAPEDGRATLEVRSPVTDKTYTMTCSGAAVTRCTGGDNAVVILY